jgi:hypothetical protein
MKLNLARLRSIQTTLTAIAEIETAMGWYADTSKQGPAYLKINKAGERETVDVQIDRAEFLAIMEAQKQKLITSLETRYKGFEYDPDADWAGDHKRTAA